MGIESPINGIWSLDETWPLTKESRREGDDHLRLIKDAIKKTFASVNDVIDCTDEELNILAGAIISTAELNYLDGVTGNLQTQIDDPTIMHTNENNITTGYLRVSQNYFTIDRDNSAAGKVMAYLRNGALAPQAQFYLYAATDGTRPNAFAILDAASGIRFIIRQNSLTLELTGTNVNWGGNALALASSVTDLDNITAKDASFTEGIVSVFPNTSAYDWDTGFGTDAFQWGISGSIDGVIVLGYSVASGYLTQHCGDTDGVSIGFSPNISGIATGHIRLSINGTAGSQNVYVWARKNVTT